MISIESGTGEGPSHLPCNSHNKQDLMEKLTSQKNTASARCRRASRLRNAGRPRALKHFGGNHLSMGPLASDLV